MKAFKIILVSIGALLIIALVAGIILVKRISKRALPDYNQDIALTNLKQDVEVYRDSTAMPYVIATDEADLYRSVGYLMAQDRLWQMDLLRRLTQGRLSELFGKDFVRIDQMFRSLHFSQKSEMVMDSCSAEIISCLDAYADGVNQYIEDHAVKLPPEFAILGYKPEKWEALHSVNLIGYMAWGLTMAWSMEINLYKIEQGIDSAHFAELLPDLSMQQSVIFPDFMKKHDLTFISSLELMDKAVRDLGLQVFSGSNNWAVSSGRSGNDHAMMANDMHLDLNAPGIWYQMHQQIPGKLDVSGVVLPGQPFVICGHNEDVAWGMTNVMLDDMDFYLETINAEDSGKYLIDGKWKDLKFEKEVIHIKGGDSSVVYNRFTHRGPVISKFKGIDDKVISMRWIGNEYSNEIKSVYKFNRMKNWADFREAASTFNSISQNIVYADKEGNIGLQTAAGIPLRAGKGIFVVPGDTSLYDWTGIVPFAELPYSYNPESGYVASANNRTVGDDFPYYISRWFDLPNRFERIREGLISTEKLTLDDFKKIQSNQSSMWAQKLVPYFISVMADRIEEQPEMNKQAFEILKSWNFEMGTGSVPSTIFEQFYVEFLHAMFYDELKEDLYGRLIDQDLLAAYLIDKVRRTKNSVWFDNIDTKDRVETAGDIAFAALDSTIVKLKSRLGDDMSGWQWGKVHTLTLKHPLGSVSILDKVFKLNRGPFAVGGSYHTVSAYSYPLDDLFHVTHGSSHRHIYIAGDWDKSQVILPTGISGIPSSPYYCSQTRDYLDFVYKTDYFSGQIVKEFKAFEMKFHPDNSKP